MGRAADPILVHESHRGNSVLIEAAKQDLEHHRVSVEMVVAVDVAETQARLEVALDLGADLPLEDLAQAAAAPPEPKPHPGRVRGKTAVAVGQVGDLGRATRGETITQYEVQTDREPGTLQGRRDGLPCRRLAHHQARVGQHAAVPARRDCLVRGGLGPEVIASDREDAVRHPGSTDEAFPWASRWE